MAGRLGLVADCNVADVNAFEVDQGLKRARGVVQGAFREAPSEEG